MKNVLARWWQQSRRAWIECASCRWWGRCRCLACRQDGSLMSYCLVILEAPLMTMQQIASRFFHALCLTPSPCKKWFGLEKQSWNQGCVTQFLLSLLLNVTVFQNRIIQRDGLHEHRVWTEWLLQYLHRFVDCCYWLHSKVVVRQSGPCR